MYHSSDSDRYSLLAANGVGTRTKRSHGNGPARPLLTSGFGAVIEKERDLQAATASSLGHVSGPHSRDIDRILQHQRSCLDANIALLERRYEALPNPERFANWNDRGHPTNTAFGRESDDESELLPELVSRHAGLQADIEALIECAPDGQRGEMMLREVSRNHEEMAWTLTALLKEDVTSASIAKDAGRCAPKDTSRAEERWDNEGGAAGVSAK